MWKMFESDFFECGDDACDGPGSPPKFHLPPPPRPPFMQDLNAVLGTAIECSEDGLYDLDVCAAIPNFDANFRNNSMLQTSAIIAVCSIFLLLVILFSSLFLWKHKRKMPNFWPCKSLPKRNGHLDTSGVSTGGHSVAYEDPDAHLHHHPLVRRHNMEMLHPKTIHFPSGYPISRSPPVFVCASPGPDPYRSLDNVYEELGPRDSDIESEPRVQSDDDFAEDELSLNGGAAQPYHISSSIQDGALATANTPIPMATSTSTCAAISQTIPSISSLYNECMNSSSAGNGIYCGSDNNNGENSHSNPNELERNSNDRHSLISSSSSSASTAPVNDGAAGNSNSSFSSGPTRIASPDSGLALRNRTKRMRNGANGGVNAAKMTSSPASDLPIGSRNNNENGSHDDTSSESNHLMNQHPYYNHHHHHHHQSQNHNYNQYRSNNNVELSHSNSNNSSISNQMNNVNNNVNSRILGNAMSNGSGHMNGSNSSDVERHNQINKQLTSAIEHPMIPKFGGNRTTVPTSYESQMAQDQMISTIFPGRLINSNSNLNNYNRIQMQNQYYSPSDSVVRCSGNGSSRSRTNPRSSRHRSSGNTLPYSYQNDNTYSYAEPVFHENMASACAQPPLHGGYRTISTSNRRLYHPSTYTPSYQNCGERDQRHSRNRNHIGIPSTSSEMGHIQPIYSHDSSFGSDSGYSQYTQNSRAKSDGSNSAHSGSSIGNNASSLSNMFSWARKDRNKSNGKPIPPIPPMRNS